MLVKVCLECYFKKKSLKFSVMNILFLTMSKMFSIEQRGIYTDLMRHFRKNGHSVYIVSPNERRNGYKTFLSEDDGVHTLNVRTLNVQKTNVIEKGLGQLSIEYLFKRAIKKYCKGVKFDLILYCTPPITFPNVIKYAKKGNPEAKTYLLLKDIFPQNAVDMRLLGKYGIKGILYNYFRNKEKKLYAISDHIGCMSPANVRYLLEHNAEIPEKKVVIAPNAFDVLPYEPLSEDDRKKILCKYGLPTDKPIFLYGGNLGIPQGIPFLIECLKANGNRNDCHFLVVGNGTLYNKLYGWFVENKPASVSVIERLPKEDYDRLAKACQVGLIFLDYRFTIPNYPSRLLSYLENKMPIIACTDPNCDTGSIAEKNGYGLWCPSNSVEAFTSAVNKMISSDLRQMGENGYKFVLENYNIQNTYDAIMSQL